MKPKTSDAAKEIDRQLVNGRTVKAYKELAGRYSKKEILTNDQKDQIKDGWKRKRERKNKKTNPTKAQEEEEWTNIFAEVQKFGTENKELLELIEQCDFGNVIHSAKITRWGEAHKRLAQHYFAKS